MIRPAGAVAGVLFVPVVEDDIAGEGRIVVVLLPAVQFSEQADETFTAAFCGNDVRQAAADGNGADEGSAPAVGVLHGVVLRQRLVGSAGLLADNADQLSEQQKHKNGENGV